MDFERPNLTLVIDRRLYRHRGEGQEPLSLVEEAILGGITMLQLRLTGDGNGEDLAADAIAHHLREMSAGKVPFLVTSDLELADRCRADGLMLVGERSYRPDAAKDYLHPRQGAIAGCFVDSVMAASRAERGGADFVQVGTSTKTADEDGYALIRKIKDAIHLPLVAFGGIDTPEKASAAIVAGADGVAVSQAILEAPDPQAAARALRDAISAIS
jgi:thiamine-phosphate pyrophosphorylase